ncbi:MAG: trypsin-like peptidase domain-containing protein [Candidatus Marinimicrobia bacterium]|nr:trypsin-like peptidase domain-containing protein [Candidatus Neomarinimicrobiota bacterium]
MSRGVVRQDPLDSAVKIRHAQDSSVVGTGIAVSSLGDIVTCAHVVTASGVPLAVGNRIAVSFAGAPQERERLRWAKIIAFADKDSDDVALLRLVDGLTPLRPEQIAIMGSADNSRNNPFQSYGCRRLQDYGAGLADGVIQGNVEPPAARRVSVDPVQIKSSQINQGMSGAGVLDLDRNLVVGVISEAWFPDASTKDRDTAWAVNARVLGREPFNLPICEAALPLAAAPPLAIVSSVDWEEPVYDRNQALRAAPPLVPESEWVPRPSLYKALDEGWNSPDCLVMGLIGFGGEGKSILLRHWVDALLEETSRCPDDLFWWDFQTNPSVDTFIGAAMSYLCGKKLARSIQQTPERLAFLTTLIHQSRRFLIVLDGFEALQQDHGDSWGRVDSPSLHEFLEAFATPEHDSLCVITSRVPVHDLSAYTTYRNCDVGPLEPGQAIALMRHLGALGTDEELAHIAAQWDAHALSISLLGTLLAQPSLGGEVPTPLRESPAHARVHFLLGYYDRHLSTAEKAFLNLASAFRSGLGKRHFDGLFRQHLDGLDINLALTVLDDEAFDALLVRLVDYRILRHDLFTGEYTLHSLVREHYYGDMYAEDRTCLHGLLTQFYLHEAEVSLGLKQKLESILGLELPSMTGWQIGDMEELAMMRLGDMTIPLDPVSSCLEALYHARLTGNYEAAFWLYYEQVQQSRWMLALELGAFGTDLAALSGFFPDRDFDRQPLVDDTHVQAMLINQVGFDLMQLGEPERAGNYLRRSADLDREAKNFGNLFSTQINLFQVVIQTGALAHAREVADDMHAMEPVMRDDQRGPLFCPMVSLAAQAWVCHLSGDVAEARRLFSEAEVLQQKSEPNTKYLYSDGGLWHVAHLLSDGRVAEAESRAMFNLKVATSLQQVQAVAVCRRLLGDIARLKGEVDVARDNYDIAIDICNRTGLRYEMAQSRLGSGRLAYTSGEITRASDDLDAALSLAASQGFALVEAQARLCLAQLSAKKGQSVVAVEMSKTARAIAERHGYAMGATCLP